MKNKLKKIISAIFIFIVAIMGLAYWQIQQFGKIKVPKFTEIDTKTYAMTEGLNQSSVYLLLGDKDAILIDAGNGLSNLPVAIQKITDLPVTVINTHGHYDHTRGNHYFNKVYLSDKDNEVYQKYNQPQTVQKIIDEQTPRLIQILISEETKTILSTPIKHDVLPLPKSNQFDFTGRPLEIIELAGHTPGSIGLIDNATKSVFVGDAITQSGYLLGLDESLSPEIQKASLLKLKNLFESGRVTSAYGGHVNKALTLDDIETGLTIVDKIISGDLTEQEKSNGRIEYKGMSVSFKNTK